MFIIRLLPLLLISLLSACTHTAPNTSTQPVPALTLTQPFTAVAAEFVTHRDKIAQHQHAPGVIDSHPSKEVVRWRFTRNENRLEIENLSANTGEIWIKDGQALFMQKVFHQDKHSIEYRMDDFAVLKMAPRWEQQALLVEPELFSQLQAGEPILSQGKPIRVYSGVIKGQQIELEWRVDLNLPQRIKRVSPTLTEETRLVNAQTFQEADWKIQDTADYQVTDYTDIGDMERDPFIIKIQSQLPGGDVHHH